MIMVLGLLFASVERFSGSRKQAFKECKLNFGGGFFGFEVQSLTISICLEVPVFTQIQKYFPRPMYPGKYGYT